MSAAAAAEGSEAARPVLLLRSPGTGCVRVCVCVGGSGDTGCVCECGTHTHHHGFCPEDMGEEAVSLICPVPSQLEARGVSEREDS